MRFELAPQYDSAQSFYKKAYIEREVESDGTISYTLYSYDTMVARIYRDMHSATHDIQIFDFYSATTLRHIKEFIRQISGEGKMSKAKLEKYLV